MPGYEDYQRLVNYDSANIVTESGTAIEKTKVLGRFFVSRFAFLVGKVQFASQPVEVIVKWFAAETGGEPVGERTFRMDNLTPTSADVCFPHMGPWMSIEYKPESQVTKYTPVVRLLNSNRAMPLGFIPRVPAVVAATPFKLAAKGTKLFRPEVYYAGPATLYVQSSKPAAIAVSLLAMLKGFEYERFDIAFTSTTIGHFPVLLPFTAQEYEFENQGAEEGEYHFAIIPSVTGSS